MSDELIRMAQKAGINTGRTNIGGSIEDLVRFAEAVRTAALSTQPAAPSPVVPGWQLVPVEPIREMLNAAIDVDSFKLGDISPLGFRCSPQQLFEKCYAAMLAAAPSHPAACASGRGPLSVGMHVTCLTAPERIWLQSDPECASDEPPKFPPDDEATWCRDRINKSDTLYIRADLVAHGIKSDSEEKSHG